MSVDLYVYLKQELPDKSQFESFAMELGFQITVHPEIKLMNATGFCPIRLIDRRFTDKDGIDSFLTGFEIYHDDFRPSNAPLPVSRGIFGLFHKKNLPKESPFDLAVRGSSVVISLRCSGSDSLEILMAYLFGAYCIKHCNAVFDDPQFGSYYIDIKVVETEIAKIVDELCKEKESGNLYTHKFDEWR